MPTKTPPVVREAVEKAKEFAEQKGFALQPSAEQEIKAYVTRAQTRGLLQTKRDVRTGTAGLISLGIEEARKQGEKSRLKIAHVDQGFRKLAMKQSQQIGSFQLGHKPHKCLLKTIIENELELRASLPNFDELMTHMGE